MVNLSIESKQFARLAAKLTRVTRGKTRNVLKEVARAFVKDCMKMTPPFGDRPVKESWKTQRDIGMAAIKLDLFGGRRGSLGKTKRVGVFETMPKAWLQKVIDERGEDFQETVYWHDKSGKAYGAERKLFKPSANQSEMREHHKKYFRNGRMSAAGTKDRRIGRWVWIDKMIVPPEAADQYLKLMQSRVGNAKAGWMQAATALGVKSIPQWISRQRGTGSGVYKVTTHKGWPAYTVGNAVPYIQEKGRELGIIKRGLKYRIHAMKKQLVMTLRKNRGK